MSSDLDSAIAETRAALLEAITRTARDGPSNVILRLAEAYAWVTDPSQPHGGGSSEK